MITGSHSGWICSISKGNIIGRYKLFFRKTKDTGNLARKKNESSFTRKERLSRRCLAVVDLLCKTMQQTTGTQFPLDFQRAWVAKQNIMIIIFNMKAGCLSVLVRVIRAPNRNKE